MQTEFSSSKKLEPVTPRYWTYCRSNNSFRLEQIYSQLYTDMKT